MFADRLFAFGNDENNLSEPGSKCLVDAVLDERPFDDWKHFLGNGLRRGEHSGAEASGENDGC